MSWHADTEEALHRRVWQVIPWVVNDSASDAQRREFRRHLPQCADCQAELERQTAVHAAMSSETPPLTDLELGLVHLRERLDQSQAEAHAVPAAVGQGAARPSGLRPLTYVLSAVVVIQAFGLSVLGYGWLTREDRTAPYQTLAETAPPAIGTATIRILPEPQMRVGELQRQLRMLELQIVSGPNAAGAYALAPQSADASVDEHIARLRATPGMLLVEPLAPPAKVPER